jgi:hypothetical protein
MSDESWLGIPGFEGLYEVSDLGRVRSMARTVYTGRSYGKRELPARILRPSVKRNGYLGVSLLRDGKVTYRSVHRLVLEAFVGPCPPGMEGCHGPNGQADNSLANLSWGTKTKNLGEDKRRDGTARTGETNVNAKLTEDDVREIRRLHALGVDHDVLAAQYPVSRSMIDKICTRECWAWVA